MNLDPSALSYPTYIELLQRALTLWYHDPTVTTPVLKLIAELVLNRSQVASLTSTPLSTSFQQNRK